MKTKTISAIPLSSIPVVKPGDDLVELVLKAVEESKVEISDKDVFVIASKIISKSEGRIVRAGDVVVSETAQKIAVSNGFNPVHVELALRESVKVIRSEGVFITETQSGLICNFSGVDKSNAPAGGFVLLPKNPDESAERILKSLEEETGRTEARASRGRLGEV